MSLPSSATFRCHFYDDVTAASSDDQRHQILEVRLRLMNRLIGRLPNEILHESAPIQLNNALIDLPLQELNLDPVFLQLHTSLLLSSFNIFNLITCDLLAAHIASYLVQRAAGNAELNFHIVVDYVQLILAQPMPLVYPVPMAQGGMNLADALAEETVAVPTPTMKKVKMEKLEEIGDGELGDCSICLDKLECEKKEVIKTPCGHTYHESCILKWLHKSHNCPLCRTPFPLDDSH